MADIVAITGQFKTFVFDLQNIWLGIRQSASGTGGRRYRCLYGFTLYMLPCAVNSNYTSGVEVHGASIHLSADGERWLGEQFAK
jgi:hypothetical protein